MSRYVLMRPGRALIAGAAIGGILVVAPLAAADFGANARFVTYADLTGRWLLFSAFSTFIFGMGLIAFGVPAWVYLHHQGHRGPVAAGLLGPSVLLSLNALLDFITRKGIAIDVGDILLAVVCGVVGLTIQRIAYVKADRIKPQPAPPV